MSRLLRNVFKAWSKGIGYGFDFGCFLSGSGEKYFLIRNWQQNISWHVPPHADRKAKAELVITNQISELKFQRLGRLNIKSCPSRLSMLCSIIRKCLSVLITSANDFQKKQIYVTSKADVCKFTFATREKSTNTVSDFYQKGNIIFSQTSRVVYSS